MTTDFEQAALAIPLESEYPTATQKLAFVHRIAQIERERLGVGFGKALHDAPATVEEGDRDQYFYIAGAATSAVALEKAREALEFCKGNINPERGFCDEVEQEITEALAAIEALKGKIG